MTNLLKMLTLRRQTHAKCEKCYEIRERYTIGYKCWYCGHIQNNHCIIKDYAKNNTINRFIYKNNINFEKL